MKTIRPSAAGIKKIKNGELRLSQSDVSDLSRSLVPGEWVQIRDDEKKINLLGFYHYPHPDRRSRQIISIVKKSEKYFSADEDEFQIGLETIIEMINESIKRRKFFKHYLESGRLIYGGSDDLPGLIVDKYENCILIQIITAGIDRYRKNIYEFFKIYSPNLDIIMDDDNELRKEEGLPCYKNEEGFDVFKGNYIIIKENDFILNVSKERFQKSGYYYDHRKNRKRFENLLLEYNGPTERGLDLFSYIGSWGLHQLRGGVAHVTFVDQGPFGEEIESQVRGNNLGEAWKFERSDVWSFLDRAVISGLNFDIITSDPPAFCKSFQEKENAIRGYLKLHQKILKVIKKGGMIAINSCTKYVSFNELDKSVKQAAAKEGRILKLIDMGIQGIDHPMKSFDDHSHYLKYLAYWVEF